MTHRQECNFSEAYRALGRQVTCGAKKDSNVIKGLLSFLGLIAVSAVGLATGPTKLYWLPAPQSLADHVSVYMDAVDMTAGTGTLHILVDGTELVSEPLTPFQNVQFIPSSDGTTGVITAGTLKLVKEAKLPNLFNSGLGLDLPANLLLGIQKNGSITQLVVVNGSPNPTIGLPFDGPDLSNVAAKIALGTDGSIDVNLDLNPASNVDYPVAGFDIKASELLLHYNHTPGSADAYRVIAKNATLKVPVPETETMQEGPMTVTGSVMLDLDGMVTSIPSTVDLTTPDANIHPEKLAVKSGPGIGLADPSGFTLQVSGGTFTVDHSKLSDYDITGIVSLPNEFTETSGGQIEFQAEIKKGQGLVAQTTKQLDFEWSGFSVSVPAGGCILDLSSAARSTDGQELAVPAKAGVAQQPLGAPWKGLYFTSANITVPETVQSKDASGNAKPLDLHLKNAYVDGHGFSGYVDSTGQLQVFIDGYGAELNEGHLLLVNDSVVDCKFKGQIGIAGWDGKVDLGVALSRGGNAAVTVATTAPISIAGALDFTVSQGSFQLDDQGQASLLLSGILHFDPSVPDIGDASITLKDVAIDQSGHFHLKSAWLDLPDPLHLEAGPLSLELSQIGFGQENGNGPLWVGLTGGVGIGGDLPIQVQGDFSGLTFHTATKSISFGSLAVDCGMDGIFHLSGELTDSGSSVPKHHAKTATGAVDTDPAHDVPIANWPNDAKGHPVEAIYGDVSFGLDCLDGVGIDGRFFKAPGCWFGMLGVNFPAAVPFGQSGFGLWGVFGGLGHDVKPDHDGATGIPMVDYDLIPDMAAINGGGGGSFIFSAGARLGQVVDPPPLWGDVALTVQIPNVNVDLTAHAYLAEAISDHIPADPSQMSRVITGDINYDNPSETFRASLTGDFYIPDRKSWENNSGAMHAHGGLDFYASGKNADSAGYHTHAYLGGPVSATMANGILTGVDIQNPLVIEFTQPGNGVTIDPIEGALTLEVDPSHIPMVNLRAGFSAGISINESGDVNALGQDIAYSVSGNASALGYADINLGVGGDITHMTGSGQFKVHADCSIAASTEIDYLVGSTTVSGNFTASGDAILSASFDTSPLTISASGSMDLSVSASLGPVSGSFDISSDVSLNLKP